VVMSLVGELRPKEKTRRKVLSSETHEPTKQSPRIVQDLNTSVNHKKSLAWFGLTKKVENWTRIVVVAPVARLSMRYTKVSRIFLLSVGVVQSVAKLEALQKLEVRRRLMLCSPKSEKVY
jgi:hypothetical protein